ncbi:MAG: 5-(carboxyamino)imidazole ribonucleotide synthase [Granulosicoccaceae bacterium]|jgi:5-(carboxyamino)imidazole ribonucleotide synthase
MKVGVLGAGQLGRMLALAGIPLGVEFVFYDSAENVCTKHLGDFVQGSFDDFDKLATFIDGVDVVTVEFEHIPVASLEWLARRVPVRPAPGVVAIAQDRLLEKQMFTKLGIPTPAYTAIDDEQQMIEACSAISATRLAKSRRAGYDGKGQQLISVDTDAAQAWQNIGAVPLIIEEHVSFQREISMIAVRNVSGETRFYPVSENTHKGGILHCTRARPNDPMQAQAEDLAQRVLDELDYVGVLAFELFDCNGTLMANEIAPRVHNSGHWTIEGAETSQFENHLRAILDLPPGSTQPRCAAAMLNLIGEMPDREAVLSVAGAAYHDYGKSARPGRKLGHITLTAANEAELDKRIVELGTMLGETDIPSSVCIG